MNTRTTKVVLAKDLKQGDVIDVRSFGYMYATRFWQLLEDPQIIGTSTSPNHVNLHLRAIHATDDMRDSLRCDMFGKWRKVEQDTGVRVWLDTLNLPPQRSIHL